MRGLDFLRDIFKGVIDNQSLEFGIIKAIDILLDLEIENDKIKQLLIKHFDLKPSDVDRILTRYIDSN